MGIDGFYKSSHSVLDEGQFGEALILSSFNYKRGAIYGGGFTANYDKGGFSAYLNAAYEWARGTNVSSAQFLFDSDEFAYIKKLGLPRSRSAFHRLGRRFLHMEGLGERASTDSMETDCVAASPTPRRAIPTRHSTSACHAGFKSPRRRLKIRFDVVNILDKIYELRDGSGIGVGAPQFGQRRGFYGTVAYDSNQGL